MTAPLFLYCFFAWRFVLLPNITGQRVAYAYRETVRTVYTDTAAYSHWSHINSVDDVWKAYPERIRALLKALNLDVPGLADLRASVQARDTVAACRKLLNYYLKAGSAHWLDLEPDELSVAAVIQEARLLLADTVRFDGVTAPVPRVPRGGWDWRYTGPQNDQEFGYSLNGHQYFLSLLRAWKLTRNDVYVKVFDRLVRDWIIHNPIPAKSDSIYIVLKTQGKKLDYRDIGEVRWRTLEAGNRLGVSWPYLFFGFQHSEAFTPAARLLMLASISEHAQYLREYHKEGHNWTTMEMNGLALTGLAFPEFNKADEWATYALDVMKKEIYRQVYPDGVQKELSSKTQWVALSRFESVADNFRKAGREIPDNYIKRLEEMYNYLAYAMRPDGHQPLNNDSDREDLRPRILKAAKKFDRPDWIWIATNGRNGVRPDSLPSVVFPWAGIHVMRNGWDRRSHWAFFDNGPFGTGHQHADKLHLSISAFGRDLLVDGGRYTHENYFSFDPKIWRGFFEAPFLITLFSLMARGRTAVLLPQTNQWRKGIAT